MFSLIMGWQMETHNSLRYYCGTHNKQCVVIAVMTIPRPASPKRGSLMTHELVNKKRKCREARWLTEVGKLAVSKAFCVGGDAVIKKKRMSHNKRKTGDRSTEVHDTTKKKL